MSSFELNKIVGALLLAVLTMVVIGKVGDNLVSTVGDHGGSHDGAEKTVVASKAVKPKKKEPLAPIVGLLASADAAAGKKVFAKCKACHQVAKDGKNAIGPNLWNIVNANRGAVAGFAYSDALKSKEGNWSYESLNAFLAKPKDYIKGTKMSFAGLKKAKDRANVVAYLREAADTPAPLPSQSEIDAVMKALEATKVAVEEAAATTAKAAVKGVKQAVAAAEPKQDIGAMLAAADIDKAMELGYRHPMGPLKLTDLVGLDVRLHIAEYLSTALGADHFKPPEILRRLVDEGHHGKKTGQGFYSYD